MDYTTLLERALEPGLFDQLLAVANSSGFFLPLLGLLGLAAGLLVPALLGPDWNRIEGVVAGCVILAIAGVLSGARVGVFAYPEAHRLAAFVEGCGLERLEVAEGPSPRSIPEGRTVAVTCRRESRPTAIGASLVTEDEISVPAGAVRTLDGVLRDRAGRSLLGGEPREGGAEQGADGG